MHFLMVPISRFPTYVDQNFVDVLEEVASTRGWSGEAVELIVQDPNSGEEYRLNSGIPLLLSDCVSDGKLDHQESQWRYAALTPDATFTLVHKFSPGLNSVGIFPDRLTGVLGSHHGPRDR
jgi:hypothetical protein